MKDCWALLRSMRVWTTWQGSISLLSVPFVANFRATYDPDAVKEELLRAMMVMPLPPTARPRRRC